MTMSSGHSVYPNMSEEDRARALHTMLQQDPNAASALQLSLLPKCYICNSPAVMDCEGCKKNICFEHVCKYESGHGHGGSTVNLCCPTCREKEKQSKRFWCCALVFVLIVVLIVGLTTGQFSGDGDGDNGYGSGSGSF